MVRRDGYVKVLDFGLAKLMEQQSSDAAASTIVDTEPGIVMGTVGYMSPEQARGVDVDARTDLWSLGVVSYEMIAGQLPFDGATSSDKVALILSDKAAPPLARFARDLPAELDRIVTKAVTKSRDERYQTAKDLLNDLKRLKQQLDVEAEIERTGASQFVGRATRTDGRGVPPATVTHPILNTDTQVMKGKTMRGIAIAVVSLSLAALLAVVYFGYFARKQGSAEAISSIAVLPFVNSSNNADLEYLSDGISESLINSLSQLPQLKVISRSSSFKFKSNDADAQAVAKALGVRAILMGRVIQRGDQLQISAELVDARDNTHIWGEQYTRKSTDVLAMESEISRQIADKLRLKLSNNEQQQLAKHETVNSQAYELMLKGRFYFERSGTENRKKGIEFYEQAVAADPNYALAYAELSDSYRTLVLSGVVQPREYLQKAETAVLKAVALDDQLAEAHNALANQRRELWGWPAADQEYQRALELNSNLARAHSSYSFYLSLMGRHDEAIAEIRRARDLDPLSTLVNMNIGYRLYFARRYDEAITSLKQTLELDPNHSLTHLILGYTYAEKGMYKEALAACQEAMRLGDDSSSTEIFLGLIYARSGERQKAEAILRRLEMSATYVSPGELADLYVGLGENEKAFAALDRAFAAHDPQLQFLGIDPGYDALRSDPRFADLKRGVGLPQ